MVFQTAWGHLLQAGEMRVDALAAVVAWYGLRSTLPAGLAPVLLLGLVVDLFSGLPGGLYAASFAGMYLMVRYLAQHVTIGLWWHYSVLVAFLGLGAEVVMRTVGGNAASVWPWGMAQAALDGLTAPVFFTLLNHIFGIFEPAERSFQQ